MSTSCIPCLGVAAREVLAPRQVVRVALLGSEADVCRDVHLLIEFAPGATAIALADWLQLQREVGRRCACRVELVSVNRLDERIVADVVARTILYDAAADA